MSVPIQRQTKGSLHQSVSLQARGEPGAATSIGASPLGVCAWSLVAAVPTGARNEYATQRQLFSDIQSKFRQSKQPNQPNDVECVVSEFKSKQSIRSLASGNASTSLQHTRRRQFQQRRHSDGHIQRKRRSSASQLSRTTILGIHCLLRTELPRGRGVPLQLAVGHH